MCLPQIHLFQNMWDISLYFSFFIFAVAGLNHGMTKIKKIPYSKYDSTSFSSVGNVVTYPKKEKYTLKEGRYFYY